MSEKEDIVMSWSGGKDSSFALYELLRKGEYNIKYLLTNIFRPHKRVSMHGVPEELIEAQAERIGIPLRKMYIQEKTHDDYENNMRNMLEEFKREGIQKVAFGDIFLEDLKKYREDRLAEINMKGLFPLWKRNTNELAQQFIQEGFKTHICSIDLSKIPEHLVGVDYSPSFIEQLPQDVDHCGENGEFHTFCYDGPIYKKPVIFTENGVVNKSYLHDDKNYEFLFSDISKN